MTIRYALMMAVAAAIPAAAHAQTNAYCYSLGNTTSRQPTIAVSQIFTVSPAEGARLKARSDTSILRRFIASTSAVHRPSGMAGTCRSYASANQATESLERTLANFRSDNQVLHVTFDYRAGGPSLEETVAWLQHAVTTNGGYETRYVVMRHTWEGSGCDVELRSMMQNVGSPRKYEWVERFNLGDMGNANVDTRGPDGEFKIFFWARTGNPVEYSGSSGTKRERVVRLSLGSESMAGRVATALAHGAVLCRATRPKDVF